MFRIDYTVYEDGNNFAPAEKYDFAEVMAKLADLLADTRNVREVTVTRDGDTTAMDPTPLMMIVDKRHRQLTGGHTLERNDARIGDQLALAAAVYALPRMSRPPTTVRSLWPGGTFGKFDATTDRLDQLAEAGAFILAEMERILRAQNVVAQHAISEGLVT